LKAGQSVLSGYQMPRYGEVECAFLDIDSRAPSKTKVRPVGHDMHICDVEYRNIETLLTPNNSI
jgi:hypothetical protein